MANNTWLYIMILLTGVFIGSVSQVLLKKSAMKDYESKIKEYLNPLVIFAYFLFVITTLLSILAYRGIDVSHGLILESTSYIYVTVWGIKIFKEKIDLKKIIALVLIIVGSIVFTVWG